MRLREDAPESWHGHKMAHMVTLVYGTVTTLNNILHFCCKPGNCHFAFTKARYKKCFLLSFKERAHTHYIQNVSSHPCSSDISSDLCSITSVLNFITKHQNILDHQNSSKLLRFSMRRKHGFWCVCVRGYLRGTATLC